MERFKLLVRCIYRSLDVEFWCYIDAEDTHEAIEKAIECSKMFPFCKEAKLMNCIEKLVWRREK